MKFLAKYRMYFLRVSILLLIVLSITNNDFRAYTLEITTIESLQMSILGFVLVVFGSFGSYMKSIPRFIPNIFKYKRPETGEKVLVKISRINGVLIEVIGYLFLYTLIDIIYFILD